MYYKIKNDKVIILAMYDTRINPEKKSVLNLNNVLV